MDKPANRYYGEQRVEIKTQKRYGPVWLEYVGDGYAYVGMNVDRGLDADKLREAAHLFVQLAEALERE